MKRSILTAVVTIAMFAFAFTTKAETVTINSSAIASITFYPTNGLTDPITITGTDDVPSGIYTAVVQLSPSYGSLISTGHVTRNFDAIMYNPYTMQYGFENFTQSAYPDTDTESATYGQASFYSVTVGDSNNTVFDFLAY
jgi:hypothetical protein